MVKFAYLFQVSDNLFPVVLRRDALDCCDCFSAGSLLQSHVHKSLFRALISIQQIKSV